MIDPVSAVATATAAYKALQKGIAVGKDLESMSRTLGVWFKACNDVKDAQDEIENPPIFKALTNKQSVEQEALLSLSRKKKIAEQEYDLRMRIVLQYGEAAYVEMMRDRDTIKLRRERAAQRQAHKRKNFAYNMILVALLGILGYMIYLLITVL